MPTRTWIAALACALALVLPSAAVADEDTDLFMTSPGGAGSLNVLIILDNTANWSKSSPDPEVSPEYYFSEQ